MAEPADLAVVTPVLAAVCTDSAAAAPVQTVRRAAAVCTDPEVLPPVQIVRRAAVVCTDPEAVQIVLPAAVYIESEARQTDLPTDYNPAVRAVPAAVPGAPAVRAVPAAVPDVPAAVPDAPAVRAVPAAVPDAPAAPRLDADLA